MAKVHISRNSEHDKLALKIRAAGRYTILYGHGLHPLITPFLDGGGGDYAHLIALSPPRILKFRRPRKNHQKRLKT